MKLKLDDKLCRKYPKIFRDRYADPKETAMCWGFEFGDGWFSLIDSLCYELQKQAKQEKLDIKAVQAKEKFGGLRFYISGGTENIFNIITFAENLSYKICEECGSMDTTVKQNDKGWIRTLCAKCRKEDRCYRDEKY